ncbi:MAG: hypothetical protein ACLU9S_08540 [Oscillospiraceae bacterium]
MTPFHLKIVTPDGLSFDGDACSSRSARLPGTWAFWLVTWTWFRPLGMGRATVVTEQGTRYAACIGGCYRCRRTW